MQELRFAIRRLRKRPAGTAAAVITLATAIAAAATTWSIVSSVLVRPLPVADPAGLVVLQASSQGLRFPSTSHLYPAYQQVRHSPVFQAAAAGGRWVLPIAANGSSSAGGVYFASDSFFGVLGVPMSLGRAIEPDDDRRAAPLVAVLSERFWQRRFDGDPAIVGKPVVVNDQLATIVGVAARRFRGLSLAEAPELYLPLEKAGEVVPSTINVYSLPAHTSSANAWLTIIGRLEPGSTPPQAAAQVLALMAQSSPGSRLEYGLIPLNTAALPALARGGIRQFTRFLVATVMLLVLVGCISIATLLLIRTEARRAEFATCLALGASRSRLSVGVALEGALTTSAAALLAVPATGWLFAGLAGFQLPGGVNVELLELSVDGGTIAAVCAGASAATLIVAMIAAMLGFSGSLIEALRSQSGATPQIARRRTHRMLVGGQVAVAMLLLGGAGLFARSLAAAMSLNSTLHPERVLTTTINFPSRMAPPAVVDQGFETLAERLRGNPAFTKVGVTLFAGAMGDGGSLVIDGQRRRCPTTVGLTGVDSGYFAAVGLQVTSGRAFSADDSANAPRVAIVSESFARTMIDGPAVLGSRITMPFSRKSSAAEVFQVVGVVPDIVTSVNVLEPLVVYMPIAQTWPASARTVFLQSASDVDNARRGATAAVREFDPQSPPPVLLSMQERLARQMGPQRLGAYVLGALGFIAVLLTMVGAYVLAESMAVIRRREMAIRAALGANSRQLTGLVLQETMLLVAIGLTAGLLVTWASAGSVRALLYRVHPLDPATLLTAAGAILVTAVAVTLRPALRAGRVDLAAVLRSE